MSATGPALLAAAAGVGFGHAVLPDHWVPLATLGRTRRYPVRRVARLATLAGVAHVLVSIILGAVLVVVGLQFRSRIQSAENTIIGTLLIATGVGFGLLQLTGHGHHDHHDHHDHEHDASDAPDEHDHHHEHARDGLGSHHDHPSDRGRLRGLAAVMVPFGAAASPDLTILPVFLAATTAGAATAVGALLVFAIVTIATIVGLTLAATLGALQIQGEWLERWGNAVTAFVLVLIGALVLIGVL